MPEEKRIHIFGASGSGTTTLGAALAESLDVPHFDTDSYLWVKAGDPYTLKREVTDCAALLDTDLRNSSSWVLSGSVFGWGEFAVPMFTLAVYLWVPPEVRLARLEEREMKWLGRESISPGGRFYQRHVDLMAWAAKYDSAGLELKSRTRVFHEQCIRSLPCRVMRIEQALPVDDMVRRVEGVLDG